MSITLINTADGSHSLFNPELNETYHSVHGAVQESRHVFVSNGFDFLRERMPAGPVRIFEVGFGTGLNALLTLRSAREHSREVHYTAIESAPLDETVWRQLNHGSVVGDADAFTRMHECPWDQEVPVDPAFTLLKRHGDIHSWQPLPPTAGEVAHRFQVIYFDAFAPAKQPDMWTVDVLKKVVDAMSPGGVFVTYCAKGQVKRDLKRLGLTVETLPGPPGKKEMVRGMRVG